MKSLATEALKMTLRCPIVFTSNIQFAAYDAFGPVLYEYVKRVLVYHQCKAIIMPHVVKHKSTIDSRGRSLYDRILPVIYILTIDM